MTGVSHCGKRSVPESENALIRLRSPSVTKEGLRVIRLFLAGHFDIFLVFEISGFQGFNNEYR